MEIATEHRRFGELHPARAGARPQGPDRALRVGWLSSDLRTHSVAFFAEPLLEHAPAWVTNHVFSLGPPRQDPMTTRLRRHAAGWDDVGHVDDASLYRLIRQRGVDVLVELNGHTGANRLGALADKPAPLIISGIGYPNTTGLGAVDRRLVDSITDPPDAEGLSTERLLRIDPCFLCYRPPDDAPEPALPSGPVVFGSFNMPSKIGAGTVSLWRAVIEAVPGSRLLIKSRYLHETNARARLMERLTGGGIDPARITLEPGTATIAEHLAVYSRVHVALDTWPYHGTTTTCEALWMGVPVVCLAGDRHASRVGASLLSAIGAQDWAASTPEAFARVAAGLAGDSARLASLRHQLRPTMKASALCDGAAYAAKFYQGLRACWRDKCASPDA